MPSCADETLLLEEIDLALELSGDHLDLLFKFFLARFELDVVIFDALEPVREQSFPGKTSRLLDVLCLFLDLGVTMVDIVSY